MKAEVHMVGRLTKDVTNVFSNQDGSAERALFTVACNSYYKGQYGAKKESVDFIPCIAWGKLVTTMTTWGKKGRLIHVIGTLETFQAGPDSNGQYPPTKIQVRLESFEFLDKKPEGIADPAKTPATGTKDIDMTKLAEMVAAKLLSGTSGGATPANNASETAEAEAAQTAAAETAQAQQDLGSVV